MESLSFFFKCFQIQIKILRVRRGFAGPVGAGFFNFITALRKEIRIIVRRGKEDAQAFPKFLIASPSFHGGRGALPSAGGHPADLTFLAGGGHWVCVLDWFLLVYCCFTRIFYLSMVVKQLKDDNFLLKCATPDQAKCPQFSFGS